jgi:manganese/iron transport system permease protein/iron/zinc/copper transport system permease protein
LLTLLVAPRYGLLADWLRRMSAVPQELMEDLLGAILRDDQAAPTVDEVLRQVRGPRARTRRALAALARQDLIDRRGDRLTLTEDGRRQARRLLRAHRLWETYLERTGTPQSQLHDRAHKLEHLHDEQTIDYLDDKLGHPLTDPHGSAIPEDFVHLEAGEGVRLSLLREGHQATIESVGVGVGGGKLRPGQRISIGPRTRDEHRWTVVLADGSRLELDHQAADAVIVKSVEPGAG